MEYFLKFVRFQTCTLILRNKNLKVDVKLENQEKYTDKIIT